MLNIISRSYVSNTISGPQKVVTSLIKGLDELGYPYCINKDLTATSQLWIHDDPVALREAARLGLNAVVGPNIYILPRNIPTDIDLSKFVYIHPSVWAQDMWTHLGFKKCPLDHWAAGIDTNEFTERTKPDDGEVIIYFKQRHKEELAHIESILKKKNISYKIISYGHYKQSEYIEVLKKARYVIWLGRQESQGIALEEAMAMNVPILVWDVLNMGHWTPTEKEKKIFNDTELAYDKATSAEYFDDRCGIKVKLAEQIESSITQMEVEWKNFQPRAYILENLSLKKQAKDLIELFNKYYKISYEQGKVESPTTLKKWRNDTFPFKAFMLFKEIAKKILSIVK